MKVLNVHATKSNPGMTAISMLLIVVMLLLTGCSDLELSESPESPDPPASPESPNPSAPPESSESPDSPTPPVEGEVMVRVFSVGEALSVFIDSGATEVLIDGGDEGDGVNGDGKRISEFIREYVDGPLEYVIATHSHADHVGGLEYIFAAYDVAHTIYGDTGTSRVFEDFFEAAQSEPDSEMKEDADEVIPLGEGVTLSILDILDDNSNTNNNSVVSVLDYYGKTMLVTGDAEDKKSKAVRTALIEHLQSDGLYPIDVYIVGHHGSETSSGDELLDVITPTYGIISSKGTDGQYKNPSREVMERLINHNVKVYGTYRSGDIKITFNGSEISLSAPDSDLLTLENYDNKDAA